MSSIYFTVAFCVCLKTAIFKHTQKEPILYEIIDNCDNADLFNIDKFSSFCRIILYPGVFLNEMRVGAVYGMNV